MKWECSECGGVLSRKRPPIVCPCCGLAGVVFVRAEGDDPEAGAGSAREAWFRVGLDAAAETYTST